MDSDACLPSRPPECTAEVPESWRLYFSHEEFAADDRRVMLIKELIDFLLLPEGKALLSKVDYLSSDLYVLPLDYQLLQKHCKASEFFSAMDVAPEEAILCLGAAAYEVLFGQSNLRGNSRAAKVNVRLHNHSDSLVGFKHLKANTIGRFVTLRGTVVRVSTVKPLVIELDFLCKRCAGVITRPFVDGKYSPPTTCSSRNCRSKAFAPDRLSAKKVDFQKLRIQEIMEADARLEGRIPRLTDCELTEDLVDACIPGDVITVCGIVKVINTENSIYAAKGKGRTREEKCLFHLYVDVVSMVDSKGKAMSNRHIKSSEFSESENSFLSDDEDRSSAPPNLRSFSVNDLKFIASYVQSYESDLFKHIVHSLCPSIYGHELVKAGIVLGLFGGTQKHTNDKNKVPIRGDVHVLIVGDPGLGKSQLLKSAVCISPRGIYVCGNSTTSAGLTAAVVKDNLSGDYAFEAGAVVLADRGLCCIDEFDKISAEHQALLEAMEQQSVSIAKAGLLANLSARTSILAAANPIGGHYNHSKTVNENLKMSAALLSRFDLIFILFDKPDELFDQRLSEHVMALHSKSGPLLNKSAKESFFALGSIQTQNGEVTPPPLSKRLKMSSKNEKKFAPLSPTKLQTYIAYAKKYVFPRLSQEAVEVLQNFYLQLREHSHVSDGTPITARQLESLVRLAEARAKVELREIVTREDAMDVVEIMKESLYDKLADEHGKIDVARTGGMSKSKESKRFLSTIQKLSVARNKPCFHRKEFAEIADEMGLRIPDLDSLIEKLNDAGYLLKKGAGLYQVQT